jgi:hypothetical protein
MESTLYRLKLANNSMSPAGQMNRNNKRTVISNVFALQITRMWSF